MTRANSGYAFHKEYVYDQCWYCYKRGKHNALVNDHYPPYSRKDEFPNFERVLIRACGECNSRLGASMQKCLYERIAVAEGCYAAKDQFEIRGDIYMKVKGLTVGLLLLAGCAGKPQITQQYTEEQWVALPVEKREALIQYQQMREQRAREWRTRWGQSSEVVCTEDRIGRETRCRRQP